MRHETFYSDKYTTYDVFPREDEKKIMKNCLFFFFILSIEGVGKEKKRRKEKKRKKEKGRRVGVA